MKLIACDGTYSMYHGIYDYYTEKSIIDITGEFFSHDYDSNTIELPDGTFLVGRYDGTLATYTRDGDVIGTFFDTTSYINFENPWAVFYPYVVGRYRTFIPGQPYEYGLIRIHIPTFTNVKIAHASASNLSSGTITYSDGFVYYISSNATVYKINLNTFSSVLTVGPSIIGYFYYTTRNGYAISEGYNGITCTHINQEGPVYNNADVGQYPSITSMRYLAGYGNANTTLDNHLFVAKSIGGGQEAIYKLTIPELEIVETYSGSQDDMFVYFSNTEYEFTNPQVQRQISIERTVGQAGQIAVLTNQSYWKVQGTVKDEAGDPIANAGVALLNKSGRTIGYTTTNALGTYKLTTLTNTPKNVLVTHPTLPAALVHKVTPEAYTDYFFMKIQAGVLNYTGFTPEPPSPSVLNTNKNLPIPQGFQEYRQHGLYLGHYNIRPDGSLPSLLTKTVFADNDPAKTEYSALYLEIKKIGQSIQLFTGPNYPNNTHPALGSFEFMIESPDRSKLATGSQKMVPYDWDPNYFYANWSHHLFIFNYTTATYQITEGVITTGEGLVDQRVVPILVSDDGNTVLYLSVAYNTLTYQSISKLYKYNNSTHTQLMSQVSSRIYRPNNETIALGSGTHILLGVESSNYLHLLNVSTGSYTELTDVNTWPIYAVKDYFIILDYSTPSSLYTMSGNETKTPITIPAGNYSGVSILSTDKNYTLSKTSNKFLGMLTNLDNNLTYYCLWDNGVTTLILDTDGNYAADTLRLSYLDNGTLYGVHHSPNMSAFHLTRYIGGPSVSAICPSPLLYEQATYIMLGDTLYNYREFLPEEGQAGLDLSTIVYQQLNITPGAYSGLYSFQTNIVMVGLNPSAVTWEWEITNDNWIPGLEIVGPASGTGIVNNTITLNLRINGAIFDVSSIYIKLILNKNLESHTERTYYIGGNSFVNRDTPKAII